MITLTPDHGKQISKATAALLDSGAWKATIYLSPTQVVRAVRRWYRRNQKPDAKRIELSVSIGPPNYLEREFIKSCRKAGEAFPVKKVQLKFRKFAK